jgi:ribosomal protein S12 methylthiotransferase
MKEKVQRAGYRVIDEVEDADAVIINTCSFIQDATEESLDMIFQVAGLPRYASGDAKVIVAGCMPARYGDELEAEVTEASAFLPCSKEDDIVALLERLVGPASAGSSDYQPTAGPYSTYVKISDGCDRFCAYCTIPFIRGRYHSFTYDTIREHVAIAVENGVREIILIAQDTGRWGTDFETPSSLSWLMRSLAVAFPQTWFRVMYLQPEGITDEFLEVMRSHDNIANYLDIPFQHVSECVLRSMNRRGSRKRFEELISHIRETIPGITLRTTLIAGYPGETDEEFEELCDFVSECEFDYIGVFAYSREEGTRAAELLDQIDDEEKRERAQQLRDLADAACTAHISERIGSKIQVLVEGFEEDGQLYGRALSQAPDVDGNTYLDGGVPGQIVEATVVDTLFYEMEVEVK